MQGLYYDVVQFIIICIIVSKLLPDNTHLQWSGCQWWDRTFPSGNTWCFFFFSFFYCKCFSALCDVLSPFSSGCMCIFFLFGSLHWVCITFMIYAFRFSPCFFFYLILTYLNYSTADASVFCRYYEMGMSLLISTHILFYFLFFLIWNQYQPMNVYLASSFLQIRNNKS